VIQLPLSIDFRPRLDSLWSIVVLITWRYRLVMKKLSVSSWIGCSLFSEVLPAGPALSLFSTVGVKLSNFSKKRRSWFFSIGIASVLFLAQSESPPEEMRVRVGAFPPQTVLRLSTWVSE